MRCKRGTRGRQFLFSPAPAFHSRSILHPGMAPKASSKAVSKKKAAPMKKIDAVANTAAPTKMGCSKAWEVKNVEVNVPCKQEVLEIDLEDWKIRRSKATAD